MSTSITTCSSCYHPGPGGIITALTRTNILLTRRYDEEYVCRNNFNISPASCIFILSFTPKY
ncbi:hypothetical protein FFB58_00345 [Enterobacter sp. MF024]|nr:hypothetical protein FFB58_00345 [Enterobacter sp. MF024]